MACRLSGGGEGVGLAGRVRAFSRVRDGCGSGGDADGCGLGAAEASMFGDERQDDNEDWTVADINRERTYKINSPRDNALNWAASVNGSISLINVRQ
jgi:hypothetical protein